MMVYPLPPTEKTGITTTVGEKADKEEVDVAVEAEVAADTEVALEDAVVDIKNPTANPTSSPTAMFMVIQITRATSVLHKIPSPRITPRQPSPEQPWSPKE